MQLSATISSAVFATIRQTLLQHTTPKHTADDNRMYSVLKYVFTLTSVQTATQMTCLHLPNISVKSSSQAVMSRITVIQVWVGQTDGHQIRSVQRIPPSTSEDVSNSLRRYVNERCGQHAHGPHKTIKFIVGRPIYVNL